MARFAARCSLELRGVVPSAVTSTTSLATTIGIPRSGSNDGTIGHGSTTLSDRTYHLRFPNESGQPVSEWFVEVGSDGVSTREIGLDDIGRVAFEWASSEHRILTGFFSHDNIFLVPGVDANPMAALSLDRLNAQYMTAEEFEAVWSRRVGS